MLEVEEGAEGVDGDAARHWGHGTWEPQNMRNEISDEIERKTKSATQPPKERIQANCN